MRPGDVPATYANIDLCQHRYNPAGRELSADHVDQREHPRFVISLFLVFKVRLDGTPYDARVVSIEHGMGLHASPTCVLSFGDHDNCVGELIGPEGGEMRAMFTMMNNARLKVGLQGVQVAEAATQAAVVYALDRAESPRAGAPAATR